MSFASSSGSKTIEKAEFVGYPLTAVAQESGTTQVVDIEGSVGQRLGAERSYYANVTNFLEATPTMTPWGTKVYHALGEAPNLGNSLSETESSDSMTVIAHAILDWVFRNDQIRLYGFVLPGELAAFASELKRSRAMLDLEDDWDGEGSPRYAEETWRRAVGLAVESARHLLLSRRQNPPVPAFPKGPEGSVDILWWSGSKKLMINVPAEQDEPVTYHGYDRENAKRETKGVLDPADDNEWMLSWLTA